MMNETLLFDSLSSAVPPVRRDIEIIPTNDDGRELFYFHDPMGYASPNFALDRQVEPILSLINGTQSVNQILQLINTSMDPFELLEFIQLMDHHRILDSKHFRIFSKRIEKDFEKNDVRKPALAGSSYPAEPGAFQTFMAPFTPDGQSGSEVNASVKALYAPHIDLRVGHQQYKEAFAKISGIKPKRVVIFATSHYAGYYGDLYDGTPFIGSEKSYQIPGKLFKPDKEYLTQLQAESDESGFTLHDRAHRVEHSIELHLLFLNRIWSHEFSIVPVLVAGLDELFYHTSGDLAGKLNTFTQSVRKLDNENTFYLISGDLSHVGRKFGDPQSASNLRQNVERTDHLFLQSATEGKADQLLGQLSSSYDQTRICGFPPLYTFLKSFPGIEGSRINYHWWDEKERESAVSFGSVLY